MENPNAAPSDNPFDQIDPNESGGAPVSVATNPFDAIDPHEAYAPESTATGAFARSAARGALPAAGGLVAAGAGAEVGAAAGALGGPLAWATVPIGAVAGGVAGMMLGAGAVSKAQDWALSKLPSSWREAIGQDDRQEKIDQGEHPVASFLGGIAPYAITMRPGGFTTQALPENATAFQRIMAHPATARVFGGAAMGGMELGQEALQGEQPDWTKIGISTGFGLVFNKPTRIGEAITELGARPARGLIGRPAIAEEAAEPTIAQAGDAKVMGPGVTEAVFQGAHEQDPSAAMTAQDAVRTEQSTIGEPPQQAATPAQQTSTGKIDALKQNGFSDDEITAWATPRRQALDLPRPLAIRWGRRLMDDLSAAPARPRRCGRGPSTPSSACVNCSVAMRSSQTHGRDAS